MEPVFYHELIGKMDIGLMNLVAKHCGFTLPQDPELDHFTIPFPNLPQSALQPERELCKACSGIDMEALRSEWGYCHSFAVQDLVQSAHTCALCDLIRLQICKAVKFHVKHEGVITDALEAIRLLGLFMAKQGLSLAEPTPVILKVDRGHMNQIGEIGGTETYVVAGTLVAHESKGIALATYLGRLLLHSDGKDSKQPLRSRGSDIDVLQRLAAWLAQRRAEVPAWSDDMKNKPLPTRVLDLGISGGTSPKSLEANFRLIETHGREGQYVTLSYCWGGYKGCRTLKENYQDRLRGIEFENVPAVFAHAVKVTRALGVRYLWIDALCIVQEDTGDWHKEAASMSDIYWNTVCRLAVTDSKNPTEGFFPPKEIVASVRVPNIKADPDDGLASTVSEKIEEALRPDWGPNEEQHHSSSPREKGFRGKSKAFTDSPEMRTATDLSAPGLGEVLGGLGAGEDRPDEDYWEDVPDDEIDQDYDGKDQHSYDTYLTVPKSYTIEVDRGRLNTRAWVLQERLLAPRTIHFTKDHIYCEDRDDICGEDWIRRFFTWMSCIHKHSEFAQIELFPERNFCAPDNLTKNIEEHNVWFQRSMYQKTESQGVVDPWLRICETFNDCEMTHQTDRLAAMAGLVQRKQFERERDGRCSVNFLGIWKDTLHVELAWCSTAWSKPQVQQKSDLNLPSWAWISHQGRVSFIKDSQKRYKEMYTPGAPSRGWSKIRPASDLQLVDANVPIMMTPLPLPTSAHLTVNVRIRQISAVSHQFTDFGTRAQTQTDIDRWPFYIDKETRQETIPRALPSISKCKEVFTDEQKLIGFISFDEATEVAKDLVCAHLSTLHNPGHPSKPMLAYALVLVRLGIHKDEFKRVGFAEINHDWMSGGTKKVVKLY